MIRRTIRKIEYLQVIGVSGTEERANLVRDKGAFASLKFHERQLMKQIVEVAAERDIAGVFEGADGENFKKILDWYDGLILFSSIFNAIVYADKQHRNNFFVLQLHRHIQTGISETNASGR